MSNELTPQQKEQLKVDICLQPFNSAEELRHWIHIFFGIYLPMGHIDPDSNSSPIEWMWEAYSTYKENRADQIPGYVVLSSRDSYKCVEKGTKLITKNNGLKPIEDVNIGDIIWSGFSWKPVTNWIDDGIKKGVKLTTDNGLSVTGSPIHRVWSWSDSSGPIWKKISELQPTDYVQANNLPFESFLLNSEEYSIGYLLGILIGDGGISLAKRARYKDKTYNKVYNGSLNFISMSSIDEFIIDFWKKSCIKYAGKEPRFDGRCTYSITSKDFISFLENKGLDFVKSNKKSVPSICFTTKSYAAGFMSGILDTDGTITDKKSVELPVTAGTLVKECQLLLSYLGINSRVRVGKTVPTGGNHLINYLIINGNDVKNLKQAHIKFSAKKKRSIDFVDIKTSDAHDSIPLSFIQPLVDKLRLVKKNRIVKIKKPNISSIYPTVSRDKVSRLVEWAKMCGYIEDTEYISWKDALKHKWVKVKTVEEVENIHFFDLTVEGDHSYWSNGIVSHNTLSESMLAVIFMVHFNATIAHLAAIESQASKAIQYINSFVKKVKPYLEAHKMEVDSQSKRKVGIMDKDGNLAYVNVIIATLAGANSEHTNILTVDEIDVMRFPQAYEEAKFIPGVVGSQFPLTIKTSTRKFAFGLMEKELQNASKAGEVVLRWNILDVTEKCPNTRHKPELPKEIRYIHPELPLQNLSKVQFDALPETKKGEFNQIEAYSGCASCPILPVCKLRLAHRPDSDVGGLYKPVSFTINQFKKTSPDMAAAQLMCWKPSMSGLVYPRYDNKLNKITLADLWGRVTGLVWTVNDTADMLFDIMVKKGFKFHVGGDWGFVHNTAFVISTVLTTGEWVLVDSIAVSGLEFDQIVELAKTIRDKFKPIRWYMDTAEPMFIKTFNKNRMKCEEFKKDVMGGIEAVRSQIIDASSNRRMLVLDTERNSYLNEALQKHHFKLDAQGNPTREPDDGEFADVADALRYKAQNMFAPKGKNTYSIAQPTKKEPTIEEYNKQVEEQRTTWLSQEINQIVLTDGVPTGGKSKNGKGFWGF